MFKKSLLALAVLGSSSAFATTTVQDATELTFATELFGSSDIVLTASGVDVEIRTTDAVSNGANAEFTYTLSDGTFGADPTLVFASAAGNGSAGISLSSGGAGESFATFTVVVTDVFDGDESFTLNVPSLAGVSLLGTAGGVISAVPTVTNTNIVAVGFDETVASAVGTVAEDSTIATSAAGVTFTATGVPMTGVDVSNQTQFSGAILVQELFSNLVFADNIALSEAGTAALVLGANDEVTVTVTGSFAEGAEVCFVPNGDTDCTNEIGTSAVDANSATITIAGNTAVAAAATSDLIYIVDGEATIPTSDFSISTSVEFNTGTYVNPSVYSSTAQSTLSLAGLFAKAERINLITSPGALDQTFIRVTNTEDAESLVYITLTTQDGETTLTGALDSIPGNATVVYTSQDIADAVGLETWTGRANAQILTGAAANNVVVVPLIRTGNVLTNQTGAL